MENVKQENVSDSDDCNDATDLLDGDLDNKSEQEGKLIINKLTYQKIYKINSTYIIYSMLCNFYNRILSSHLFSFCNY